MVSHGVFYISVCTVVQTYHISHFTRSIQSNLTVLTCGYTCDVYNGIQAVMCGQMKFSHYLCTCLCCI